MEILVCPLCRSELVREGASLRCSSGHSYDIARSGYVNLHRPGIKSNARSGDSADMVQARRAFLSRGHYDRYVREAARSILRVSGEGPGTVIDAACGEGHHTMILADELRAPLTVGIDASKKAADIAAKAAARCGRETSCGDGAAARYGDGAAVCGSEEAAVRCGSKESAMRCGEESAMRCGEESAVRCGEPPVRFIAGNIFDMPIADESADIVTTLFAPVPESEALRVLRRGGLLCVCGAGREHLIELRRAIYDTVRYKDKPCAVPEGFELAAQENISYRIDLDSGALADLFVMTPFYQRIGEQRRENVAALGDTEMTVSVDLTIFRKL